MQNQEKENQMGSSRIVKFRAWNKEKKVMTILESQYVSEALHYYEKGLHELMQSTGLLDKNGKEIYEGDIVKSGFVGKVYWEGAGFYVKFFNQETGEYLYNSIGFFKNNLNPDELETIGNIYENPELLNNK